MVESAEIGVDKNVKYAYTTFSPSWPGGPGNPGTPLSPCREGGKIFILMKNKF